MNLRKFLWAGLCGASLVGAVNPVVANAALDVYSNHRRQPPAMRLCPPLVAAISGFRATGMDGVVITSGTLGACAKRLQLYSTQLDRA